MNDISTAPGRTSELCAELKKQKETTEDPLLCPLHASSLRGTVHYNNNNKEVGRAWWRRSKKKNVLPRCEFPNETTAQAQKRKTFFPALSLLRGGPSRRCKRPRCLLPPAWGKKGGEYMGQPTPSLPSCGFPT